MDFGGVPKVIIAHFEPTKTFCNIRLSHRKNVGTDIMKKTTSNSKHVGRILKCVYVSWM